MTNRFVLPLLLFLLPAFSFAQQTKTDETVNYKRAAYGLSKHQQTVSRFTVPSNSPGHSVTAFPTPFAQSEFGTAPLAAIQSLGLNDKAIEKVQLVYTSFALSPSFDQKGLNGKRLQDLYRFFPHAFDNPLTEWELVAQTGAKSPEEGRDYFHGFVIYWRPDASPELIRQEMKMLDSLVTVMKGGSPGSGGSSHGGSSTTGGSSGGGGKTGGSSTEITGSGDREITYPDGKKVLLSRDIPEDSLWRYIRPSSESYSVITAKWGDTAHTVVIVTEKNEAGYKVKRTWKLDEHKGDPVSSSGSFAKLAFSTPDTVVTSVFRRNAWQNMVVCCDVTGSMSPYTAQLFNWLPSALAGGKCSGFVFFNDGDKKSNGSKSVGKTGGIYSTRSMAFDTVFATAMTAMKNGDGGDAVENDLEAVIFALDMLSPQGDIVLVADNWGAPRDLELFEKINRPVHIVVCGARGGLNPDYLFLARQTGGSVHTGTDDITNLAQMQEGETVKIGFQTFLLHNNHFVPLDNFSKFTY